MGSGGWVPLTYHIISDLIVLWRNLVLQLIHVPGAALSERGSGIADGLRKYWESFRVGCIHEQSQLKNLYRTTSLRGSGQECPRSKPQFTVHIARIFAGGFQGSGEAAEEAARGTRSTSRTRRTSARETVQV